MITFQPFNESHFSLMLKWLEAPHVKKWWDQDLVYTIDLVKEKYSPYIKGYKRIGGIEKPIHAYIIYMDSLPIGYIQQYSAYDFPRENLLLDLPEDLGALDLFIGEKEYLHKGIGSLALQEFLHHFALKQYTYIFVDPDYENAAAVRAYEKSGFVIIKRVKKTFWMIAHTPRVRLSVKDVVALEITFRKIFLKDDRLWVFGSRAHLYKKGGDIDLYIETHIPSIDEAAHKKCAFITELEERIGEQKIDVVLNHLASYCLIPIYEIAQKEGVRIL